MAQATNDSITRRRLVGGIAAGTVAAIPTAAIASSMADDPIFAAIARFKAIGAALVAADDPDDSFAHLPAKQKTWSYTVDSPRPPVGCTDDPAWIAAQIAAATRWDEFGVSIAALLTTRPTTMAGLLALLDCVGGPEFPNARVSELEPSVLLGAMGYTEPEIPTAALNFPALLKSVITDLMG